jgi:hypothetical protein
MRAVVHSIVRNSSHEARSCRQHVLRGCDLQISLRGWCTSAMDAQPIALGKVICQRSFDLYTPDGQPRSVSVLLGMPVPTTLDGRVLPKGEGPRGIFRCPFQITGLHHDERVEGAFGEDSFIALQYAIDFIGDRLNLYSKKLGLTNTRPRPDGSRDSWIWTYPPDR